MEPILQLNTLIVKFDTSIQRVNAVDHVSLHVKKGEIVGIIGESGSGKSTLAKTILGLYASNQTTEGSIQYITDQKSIELLDQSNTEWVQFRKNHATIVFQNPLLNLNPSSTIRSHFDRIIKLQDDPNGNVRISEALFQVDLATDEENILSAYPHQLSGGQQQRILIALAIFQEVKLLLLDEPMSSLDKRNQDGIANILLRLVREKGLSIILISHDLNIIGELSDRIYVLKEGQVIEEGTKELILNDPQHAYTRELVYARNVTKKKPRHDEGKVIIEIKGLSHNYRKGGFLSFNKSKVQALSDINVLIQKGSITGLVGPSGSGKTTLVKVLLGIEKLQQGEIYWNGTRLNKIDHGSMSKRIQIIPQNTTDGLNPRMLLDDQLKEVYRKHYRNTDTYEQILISLLTDVNLENQLRYRYPSELSGGEIQRMAIVRALILRPDVLVLDESLSALDMVVQKRLVELLLGLNGKLGMTIIMISHDDRLIGSCCDVLLHLDQGALTSM